MFKGNKKLTKLSDFMEKRDREFIKQNGSTSYPTPIPSLTSSDSCVSSCSDFSVDASSNGRGYQEEASTDSGQEDINFSSKGLPRDFSLPTHVNGVPQSNIVVKNVNNGFIGCDTRIIENGDDQTIDNGFERDDENDAEFWLPPEPEDYENDIEGSVANYEDDDDDCGDGVKWGKPSSLSSFEEVGSGSYRCKEAKQKAMNEVMNGKFKALVSQLLKSVGVDFGGKDGDSWVEIVTSLSWKAASFVKPDTVEGKATDPDGYVKIKCIATGSRNESQLFKGLVFKKHAAHKHMPTTYKNPRLLLIQGALDLSSSGFSSLLSDDQKKISLNSIIQMIERCHPNVVLVEKSVSGDIQESIREKGMTLVFDMKLHRLERVARCIGSSILSSDLVNGQRLKQCDSFCFEKFVEEHNTIGEGGKRPSKTLMFLEGCPTRLGCTILLKGTRSDELKKIKCVVQYAVLVAYHLILETSFLLDQRAMFATIPLNGLVSILANDLLPPVKSGDPDVHDPDVHNPKESRDETEVSCAIDVPISNGFHEEGSHEMRLEGDSSLFYEPYNPIVLSLSSSLKKAIGDNFPLLSTSHQSISTYFGFNGRSETPIEISSSPEATDNCDMEIKGSSDEENELNNEPHSSTAYSKEACLDTGRHGGSDEDQTHSKDDITTLLDSESILVLLSRRNASKGTICEQSHFSHIKFYRNFDVPLGNCLRDNILSQRLVCNTCGEPPESHIYYYAHHNKQLTIQIRRLPEKKRLAGENEGKLWMWSCCGKCKRHKHGKSKSTRRVLVSDAARDFSFGKFLELSLSNHSSFSVPSSCGHYLHRDFYYFFGLGPMVAMFKYSPVATYSVSLPPQVLEFGNSSRRDLLHEDFANVHAKGDLMFLEIEKSLKAIGTRFEGLTLNLQGSLMEFSDIVKMLKLERHQFQVDLQSIAENWDPDVAVYKHVSLNRIRWELLLESCVWDLRVYSLLSSDLTVTDIGRPTEEEADMEEITVEGGNDVFDSGSEITDSSSQEIPIEGFGGQNESNVARINENGSYFHDENPTEDNLRLSSQLGEIVQNAKDVRGIVIDPNPSQSGKSLFSMLSNLENSKGWIWTPFPEIRREFMLDLHRGFSPKFEPINIHARGSRVHDMINEEGSRLHIPLGSDDLIVSDYEDELSSIIACALALLNDIQIVTEDFGEETKVYDNSHALARLSSLAMMPHWSSFGSLDSDGFDSLTSISSEEGSHGLHLLDCLASLRVPHPEVSMGLRKFPGKGKNSVVCLYANKFRDLRNRCCSSELAYIASLSRCMNWDAKGGKSKSFFAKTRDERFIIKEIKRIEFDSFMKFASDYFTYMNQCHELGNQTCLAKILGIYQVREMKGGKETRHDLMVMENLTFCRHVTRQYDLKGALHARFNSSAGGSGDDILLDQNFVNDMNVSPLYVSRSAKRDLQRAVWNDTTFLNSINVMDYSLLVGVDSQKRELVCGIIDYLRQYTWDKQLENWVKSSLVVPRNQLPTVISPKEYKKRFRKFITTHFLSVPDTWCIQSEINDGDSSHHNTRSQEVGEKLNSTA